MLCALYVTAFGQSSGDVVKNVWHRVKLSPAIFCWNTKCAEPAVVPPYMLVKRGAHKCASVWRGKRDVGNDSFASTHLH